MGTEFIDHCSVHFSSCRKCFSSKCNSHSTECFVASQSLLLTKRIYYFCYSTFFKGKWNFANCFFSLLAQPEFRRCTFIKHFLKHKVVIFAEFLKHICERVNFSKVRGLTACNFSNNKYFHRYFSKILLNLIRQLLKKHFSMTASNKA